MPDRRILRLSVLGIVALSLFVALFGRLWYLQMIDAPTQQQVIAGNSTRTVTLPPMRGRILDKDGRILADNRRSLEVVVDRNVIKTKKARTALFNRLAGALGTTPDALEKRYNSDQYDPYLPLPLADDVDEGIAVYLKERREDYPGVDVQEGWQRVYRWAPFASHILGYVGRIPAEQKDKFTAKGYQLSDTVGRNGVELSYEDDLRGKPGSITFEVDARGRVVRVLDRKEPVPGNDIQLTINLQLQQYAEIVLKRGLEEARTRSPRDNKDVRFSAPAGATVIVDPNNGGVLAMATYPTYDNRWFVPGISNDKFKQLFPNDERSPLVNRAVSGQYSLGSTMKLFTAWGALSSGVLPNANVTVDDRGIYTIPNCPPVQKCDWKNAGNPPAAYGRINLQNALSVSSDVYFYWLGYETFRRPGDVLQNQVRQFGLGSPTGIDLPNEYAGTVPDAKLKADLAKRKVISPDEGRGYFSGDNMLLAIGQGLLSATPLQLADGYATFANGGTRYKPRVVQAVLAPGTPEKGSGIVDLSKATILRSNDPVVAAKIDMPPQWRDPIMRGLIGVTRDRNATAYDTFQNYDYARFPIAGKTGTAQDYTQKSERDSSLFAAFGPIGPNQTPQYAISAVLEKAGFGAWGAAPVVKCLFEGISGQTPMPEVRQADPLDRTSSVVANIPPMPDPSCLFVPNTSRD